MLGRSWRLGRIAGIPIGISPWWLAIVFLISWSLGSGYFPDRIPGIAPLPAFALGLASALLLFASILVHELGHAVVARRHGVRVAEIDLWLLGGVARMENEAEDPGSELRYAIAGPAVTAAVLAGFGVVSLLLPASTPAAVTALVDYQVLINALILGFNLIPAFPLDGGRIARSLLWRHWGDMHRATRTAAGLGRGFGYALIALGVVELLSGFAEGLWFAVVGAFIIAAARGQEMGAEIRAVFSGVQAVDVMSHPVVCIPGELSVRDAVGGFFGRYGYTAFPVVDQSGRLLGLITIRQAEAIPWERRATTQVADVADRDPGLAVPGEVDVATLLERPAFARVGRAVVITADRTPIGLLSITDVQRAMRAARLRDAGGSGRAVG